MVDIINQEPILGLVFFTILGLLLGSFANVLILRIPEGESPVAPRSRCPKCKEMIAFYDNIPIFSWILLGGRCRHCKAPIHWRYPFVEILTAAIFAALYAHIGLQWILLEYSVFAYGLIVVTFIDFDHMILPDVFTLPGIVIGLLGSLLNPERQFWPAMAGVLMGGGFLYAVAEIYSRLRKTEGMGGGDIKLLAWIGAVLGWTSIPFVILGSSIIGSIVGSIVAMKNKKGFKQEIPFGPYLVLAAFVYIFGGQEIAEWYFNLFIPMSNI